MPADTPAPTPEAVKALCDMARHWQKVRFDKRSEQYQPEDFIRDCAVMQNGWAQTATMLEALTAAQQHYELACKAVGRPATSSKPLSVWIKELTAERDAALAKVERQQTAIEIVRHHVQADGALDRRLIAETLSGALADTAPESAACRSQEDTP